MGSAGEARLSAPPAIQFNFFASDYDRRTLVEGVKYIRKMARTSSLSAYVAEEINPGPKSSSEEDFVEHSPETRRFPCFMPRAPAGWGYGPMRLLIHSCGVHGLDRLRVD